MTYKIEITNDYDELIDEIEFDNFADFIHFFNDTDRKREYSIKYREKQNKIIDLGFD